MSYHPLNIKVESAMRSYLTTNMPTYTIRGSEHVGQQRESQSIYVICETGDGVQPLTGNGDVEIRVEVRTMTHLFSSFASSVTSHQTLCGTVFDLFMDDGLKTSLTVSGLTIQGVFTGEFQQQRFDNGTLINSMTRKVRAVPQ